MSTNHSTIKHGSTHTSNPHISELCQQHRTELNDLGNATRFIESFSETVRYVPARGWFLFFETHWQSADSDTMLSLARESLEDFLDQTSRLTDEETEHCERILKHLAHSESLPRLQALLRLARTFPDLILPHTALDANPFLLNLRNGILDLRSGELLPHNPEHYLTQLLPYDFDPSATAPIWHIFLDRLTDSDPALQLYLQRAIGSTLFGSSNESTTYILTGPGQRAHQLLLSTLRQLLGSYSTHTLALQQRTLSPTLLSSRLLTLSCSFPQKVDPTLLFALLNHEPLSSSEFVFQPHTTLWLSTLELPQLPDSFAPLREYLQPIPLSLALSSYEAAQISTQLQQVLPAILNWAVEGFQLWFTEAPPAEPISIQHATTTFHEDQDPITLFLAQSCTSEPDQSISAHELYQAYVTWAHTSGERSLSASRFGSRALASGLQRTRHASGRFYQNLKLISPIASSSQSGADTQTGKPNHLIAA